MAEQTGIEWTRGADGSKGATWNPPRARNTKTGAIGWHCEHVTEACRHCYAEGMNFRFGTQLPFKPGHLDAGDVEIFLDDAMLRQPLSWEKPRKVFVCSMTDLFARFVTREMRDRMFAVMALARQHIYIILTKRPEEMLAYLSDPETPARVNQAMEEIAPAHWCDRELDDAGGWPLNNVWAGASIHDQRSADAVVPIVLQLPAAVRFLSIEPLLGPVDLTELPSHIDGEDRPLMRLNALRGLHHCGAAVVDAPGRVDWVIAGGESGRMARPPHPSWFRALRDQCEAAAVPFFFKQWGEWAPHKPQAGENLGGDVRADRVRIVHPSGRSNVEIAEATGGRSTEPGSKYMKRLGKATAGRRLDGATHDAYPEARP